MEHVSNESILLFIICAVVVFMAAYKIGFDFF